MVTSAEREAALNDLRDLLSQGGVDVDLQITHYEPGRRGLPPPWTPENVAIFIGSNVASGFIGAVTADIYARARQRPAGWWALRVDPRCLRAAVDRGDGFSIAGSAE
jgi:hypothetical protein